MRRLMLALVLVAGTVHRVNALDQGGSVETWVDAYHAGEPELQGWFRATYYLDAQPKPWLFFKLAAIFELDTNGDFERDRFYDDPNRELKCAPFRFRDFAVGFRAGETTIVVGRQRLTFKRTTFVNATDNLTPRDWTDPLDETRLSPWAIDVAWVHDRWSVEGALVPQYAPSRLPQLNGRWFEAQSPIELTWGEAEFPPVTWDTLQAAVFAGYRGSRGEVRVSYFHGYDDAPRITAELTTLNRTFVPLHVAGLDGEVLVGPVILRGEAGYFHFPAGADNGYALYQVEAEWSRASWRVIGGYGGSVGGDPATSDPASLDQAFLPSVFLAVLRGDATEWQIGLDATIGFRERDSWVHLTGSYPFLGHARVGASVDLISGDPGTFWGRWRDNDRLTVFLSLNF